MSNEITSPRIVVALMCLALLAGCSTDRAVVTLPRESSLSAVEAPTVRITSDGSMSVVGQATTAERIPVRLRGAGVTTNSPIIVLAAPDTKYSAVLMVVETLKKAGYVHITLATTR